MLKDYNRFVDDVRARGGDIVGVCSQTQVEADKAKNKLQDDKDLRTAALGEQGGASPPQLSRRVRAMWPTQRNARAVACAQDPR